MFPHESGLSRPFGSSFSFGSPVNPKLLAIRVKASVLVGRAHKLVRITKPYPKRIARASVARLERIWIGETSRDGLGLFYRLVARL